VKIRLVIMAGLLLVSFFGAGCARDGGVDAKLHSIIKPYVFSIVKWESKAIPQEIGRWIFGRDNQEVDSEIQIVTDYFAVVERIGVLNSEIEAAKSGSKQDDLASLETELGRLEGEKGALEIAVERIIEQQIKETLAQEGIRNPMLNLMVTFPPVNFVLEKPPHMLVISPRDRIESMREITLLPDISLEEIEAVEFEVDELGVSSLVVGLGGLGATYPTFVTNEASLRFTINAAAEEWLHQYLVFKPLGFRYLLDLIGVSRNYEVATMNETVAGIVSKEIGSLVYGNYYAGDDGGGALPAPETGAESEFTREMRETRIKVDRYLAQGEIEQAEEFMEQERQYLVSRGYNIRKLNQAYFAFYGTYADSPISISPIGLELKELRNQSASLKDFLDTAASMTSRQDLIESIK